MRRIKEVLRLAAAGRSQRELAQALGMARSTVAEYLKRAERAGLTWPLAPEWNDVSLERTLFPPPPALPAESRSMLATTPSLRERFEAYEQALAA
jgi:transcriptional regulator with XRE-family HTH domain